MIVIIGVVEIRIDSSPEPMCVCPHATKLNGKTFFTRCMARACQ